MSYTIVGGCRYPKNYRWISQPLYSSPHGGEFIKLSQNYQDYQDTIERIIQERKRKREEQYKKYNEDKARKFWEEYFGGFFSAESDSEFSQEEKNSDYPYNVFGLKKSASNDDVKKAYRKSILKSHPDKPGGSADVFRKVQSAWEYFKARL